MTTPPPHDPAAELAHLRAAHDQLTDTVEHLVNAMETLHHHTTHTTPGDWSWQHMNADRAATVWNWLNDFVDHLNTREELNTRHRIPPCWHLHTRTIEDLTALLAAWQDAYHNTTGPTQTLINYRDRWLWPTLNRLTEQNTPLRRCIDKNQHTPWTEPTDNTYLDPQGQPLDRKTHLAQHAATDTHQRPPKHDNT
ncbi:DUF4913 domain-containing protein [Actinosynnema sp. CS-041913]|uniref:DUF4913 domain-containing protein n=1 Tax=Actinosynnema sp. CS-041913 TaxID=3239917 RepID=UPI003D8A02E4